MQPRLTATQKAAILVANLDRHTADLLLAQMGREEAAAVRRAVIELDHLDPHLIEDVLDEFREFSDGSAPPSSGGEVTWEPSGAEPQDDDDWSIEPAQTPDLHDSRAEQRFRCLFGWKPTLLARYFEREHPQTVAVIFSHLAPEQSADILACLPPMVQSEVLRRLADLEDTDPEVLRDLETSVEKWLGEQDRHTQRRRAGLAAIERILASAELGAKDEILNNLGERDREFAQQLGLKDSELSLPHELATATPQEVELILGGPDAFEPSSMESEALEQDSLLVTFDELVSFGDEALATLFAEAEPEVVRIALTGAPQSMVNRVLSRLSATDQRLLRRSLTQLGPLRLSDVELSQQHLAKQASELIRAGIVPMPRYSAVRQAA